MKTTSRFLLAVAAAVPLTLGSALAQNEAVTKPVGYRTDFAAGGFNLIGLNLENPVLAAGALESAAAGTITDNEATFLTSLAGSGQFVLKVTGAGSGSAAGVGMSTTVTPTSDTVLATGDNLSTVLTGGETYEIRKSVTIEEAFGETNEAGLSPGAAGTTGADILWVPNDSGGFTRVYYNGTAGGFPAVGVGWKGATTGNVDASETPIYFTDGIFIQRPAGAQELSMVLVGHVDTIDTEVAVMTGFNFLSRVLPVGITLAESGLETELAQGVGGPAPADIIWIPNDAGGYDRFYFNGVAGGFPAVGVGWKGATTGNVDQSAQVITSGFVLERKGAATMVTLAIPDSLDL